MFVLNQLGYKNWEIAKLAMPEIENLIETWREMNRPK